MSAFTPEQEELINVCASARVAIEQLTPAERRAFDSICAYDAAPDASRRVLESLVAKHMVLVHDETLPGWPPVVVKRYSVPMGSPMHVAWAALSGDDEPVDH